jgi:anhydro-N-acetylmuramic acid kinase
MGGKIAVGLMSGTSLDGVDVALIETDGETVQAFGPAGYRAYTDSERKVLRQSLADAAAIGARDQRPGAVSDAESVVTRAHIEAVESFLSAHSIDRQRIDVVGFHGQTVLHRPERRLTVQIGDGGALARAINIPVVYDLRAADVAVGGQGAPLVPVYHRALTRMLDHTGPVCVVNIGGVSNITYIDGDDVLVACDTGPGNALLDDFMLRRTGEAIDRDGAHAASGRVDRAWIDEAMATSFFKAMPPKSLDRNDFAALALPEVSVSDGAATLTAFTAASIARIADLLPKPPCRWIVSGGGARNPTMMRMLSKNLDAAEVVSAASLGWQSDAIEAQAFAFLAVRSLMALPLSFPDTTGVPEPMRGGVLARP